MGSIPFSASEFAAFSPEIAVAIGASVILIWGALSHARGRPLLFAGLTQVTLLAAAASIYQWVWPQMDGHAIFAGQFTVDSFGVFFAILFLVAAALAVGASNRFLCDHGADHPEFYFLLLTSLLGMMVMARSIDFISLFVGLELQALSVYVLVGYMKTDRNSNEGSLKYFILGGLSSGIFLFAISLLYALTGTTKLAGIAQALQGSTLIEHPVMIAALVLMTVALGFKIAAVPFHLWAPDAYTGAPIPVALFISVASKLAAFAMMIRILFVGLMALQASWSVLLAVLAAATMTLGNVAALTQDNVKRMLAYSSIAHAGYALIGVVVASPFGMAAALYYFFAYTFMNIGAWATVALLRRQGLAGERVEDFAGLAQKSYWATAAMLLFLLSLGGIPPTAGFLGKWYLFGAAIESGWAWLAVLGVVNAVISLYYYLRVVVAMTMTPPSPEVTLVRSLPLNITLAVSAAMTLVGILWATPFIEWVRSSTLPIF